MHSVDVPLPPSLLARLIAQRFRESGLAGTRVPLESRLEIVEDGGLRFVVRVLAPRRRSAAAAELGAPARHSPFLPPYEPTLLVGAISPTHVCLLNKYNVVDRHVLIATREFEEQDAALTLADFAAVSVCLGAIDGLVFYNSGPAAGASQPHKHLQLVPFPLGSPEGRFPLDAAIRTRLEHGGETIDVFRFRHSLQACGNRRRPAAPDAGAGRCASAATPPTVPAGTADADRTPSEELAEAECALAAYRSMIGPGRLALASTGARIAPHNLLMTRDWMLVVARSREAFRGIEVNALGFAGALIARGDAALATVRAAGPLAILAGVAVPP